MKILQIILITCMTFMLCSCGHNVVTVSKGLGLNLSWDGANYVPNIKLGNWDVITYVPRGNTSMTTTTVTGGNLGSGGVSQSVTFSSGVQLNQKNIVQICNNPHTSNQVKAELVKVVATAKPPVMIPSTSKTVAAAAAVGPQAKDVAPVSTGVDKIVDAASQNAGKAIQATKDVANNAVDSVQDYSKEATKSISTKALILFSIISTLVIFAIIFLIIYFVKRKKKANEKLSTNQQEVKEESELDLSAQNNLTQNN